MQDTLGSARGLSFTAQLCQVQPGSARLASFKWGKRQRFGINLCRVLTLSRFIVHFCCAYVQACKHRHRYKAKSQSVRAQAGAGFEASQCLLL